MTLYIKWITYLGKECSKETGVTSFMWDESRLCTFPLVTYAGICLFFVLGSVSIFVSSHFCIHLNLDQSLICTITAISDSSWNLFPSCLLYYKLESGSKANNRWQSGSVMWSELEYRMWLNKVVTAGFGFNLHFYYDLSLNLVVIAPGYSWVLSQLLLLLKL